MVQRLAHLLSTFLVRCGVLRICVEFFAVVVPPSHLKANRVLARLHYPAMHTSPSSSLPRSAADRAWVRRLDIPADLLPSHAPVIAAGLLARAGSARDMLVVAADDAAGLQAHARQQADSLLAQARDDGRRQVFEAAITAQRQVWQQATTLLAQLHAERLALREQAADMLSTMLAQLSKRLLLTFSDITPALSSVRLLVDAWAQHHAANNATLYLHPEDLLALPAELTHGPGWQVHSQSGLLRGDCVLAYDGYEMHASFNAHVTALSDAIRSDVLQDAQSTKFVDPFAHRPNP